MRWPVAFALVLGACSLEGLSGVPRDADAPPEDGGGSSDATAKDAGGCGGCKVLVTQEDHPTEIVELDGDLVWIRAANDGHVVRSRLDGTNLAFERDFEAPNAHHLVVQHGDPYVVSEGRLFRFFTFSTCIQKSGVEMSAPFGTTLLLVRDGVLQRGECGASFDLVTETFAAIDGDGTSAWWATPSGDIVSCNATADQCAATRTIRASAQGTVTAIAHDDTRIFWITGDEVRGASKTGSEAPTVLGKGQTPKTLAPTGSEVYWTDIAAGTVVRSLTNGGDAIVIASGLSQPWGIVADTTSLYVTEAGLGRILRVPR